MARMPDWSKLAGKFLVLDGGEGCGKSTQLKRLHAFLHEQHDLPVALVRDPGSTKVGEQVRSVLLDPANDAMAMRCEMLLYMAARAQMLAEVIRPALSRGEVVLCDRFVSSTLAYQLGGDGLTRDEILAVGEAATAGRWPDLTIILDMPVEASQRRVKPKYVPLFAEAGELPDPTKDRIEQRPMAYHAAVRENFLEQVRVLPHRYAVVDADQGPDAVFGDLLGVIGKLA